MSAIDDFSETLALFNCRVHWAIFLVRCRLRLISLRRSLLGKGVSFVLARTALDAGIVIAAPPAGHRKPPERRDPSGAAGGAAKLVFLTDRPVAVNQSSGSHHAPSAIAIGEFYPFDLIRFSPLP